MKRMICVLLAILLLPVFATTAFAHGNGGHIHAARQHRSTQQIYKENTDCVTSDNCTNTCRYVDENSDNICDNCNNWCAECGEIKDDNADGICDNCGKCSHYADADQDGVCDYQADCENRKNTVCGPVHRNSRGHGRRHGNHH